MKAIGCCFVHVFHMIERVTVPVTVHDDDEAELEVVRAVLARWALTNAVSSCSANLMMLEQPFL